MGNPSGDPQCSEATPQLALQEALRRLRVPKLKPWQQPVLQAWERGQDSLILSGTGSGKSLCFQLPALLANGIVIVISPLIALMRDQVASLMEKGVPACFLGSGQTDSTVESRALAGSFRIV